MQFRQVQEVPPVKVGKWASIIEDFLCERIDKAEVPLVDVLTEGESNDENLVSLRSAGMQRGVRVSRRGDFVYFELV